jgi:hypothetical protein
LESFFQCPFDPCRILKLGQSLDGLGLGYSA